MDLNQLLYDKWTYPLRKGYDTVEGYTVTRRYTELKKDFDNLEVDENDIWICAFPKTGCTWTQEMVWMIKNNLDFEKGKKNLDERSPFLDFSAYYDKDEFTKFDPPTFLANSVGFYKSIETPRIVKTHLPYELLPIQIRNGVKKPKIIYVVRNPKDTCVSYYHHAKLMEGFRGDFNDFCQLFLGNKILYGPYSKHIQSFWENRSSLNFLLLKYEDMKKDLSKIILQVANFLQVSLSNNQVETLTKHLSFDTMKNNKAVNKDGVGALNNKFKMSTNPDGKFMRNGKVGDYKNIMDEAMSKRFDTWVMDNFKQSDFTF